MAPEPTTDRVAEAVQEVVRGEYLTRRRMLRFTGLFSLATAALIFAADTIYTWRLGEFSPVMTLTNTAFVGSVTFVAGYVSTSLWLRIRRPGRVRAAAERAQVDARDVSELLF